MSDEEQQEREGEDEVVLEGQVPEGEVVADEDLGALGMVPEKVAEEKKEEEGENKNKNENEGEVEEEEVPVDPNDPGLAKRVVYIRHLRDFFKERALYYRGKRLPKNFKELVAIKKAFQEKGQEHAGNATYSANGKTLTLLNRNGKLKYTIQMQAYRPPTQEEQEAALEKQRKQIAKAEILYETAIEELKRVSKTDIHGDIKTAQRRVAEADRLIQSLKYPEKAITTYESIEIREIDFDHPLDVHKTMAFALSVGSQKIQKVYAVPYDGKDEEEAPPEEVLGAKKRVIIFASKPVGTYDFLSSFYANPFEYKGHEYKTAYQAIMATMADKFGDDEKAEEIRGTDDPEAIELTWDKVEGATLKTWNLQLESTLIKINRAKFAKDPKLAARLLKTGEARIAAVPPENETDPFQGIGLTEEDPNAQKKSRWKGKNIYGMALEQIREELAAIAAPAANAVPKPAVATEEPKPKRLLRRLVPLSATAAVTKGASNAVTAATQGVVAAATQGTEVLAQSASDAAAAVTKGASDAAAAVAKGASNTAAAATKSASNAAAAVTKSVSSAASDVVASIKGFLPPSPV